MKPDLFLKLLNHRISDQRVRKEDYLTACLGWVLQNDAGLRKRFLAPGGPVYQAEDQAPTIGSIGAVTVETQRVFRGGERPDLYIFEPGGFDLLIECKVDAPFDPDQVNRYLALNEGPVVCIVPRSCQPDLSSIKQGGKPPFLGVRHWEDIATFIEDGLADSAEPERFFHICLLELLDSYRLVRRPNQEFRWMDEDGQQNIDEVEQICTCLTELTQQVEHDPNRSLANQAPALYRPKDDKWKFSVDRQISQSTHYKRRPILVHHATLCTPFPGEFCSVTLRVHFRTSRDYTGPLAEPCVSLDFGVWRHLYEDYHPEPMAMLKVLLERFAHIDPSSIPGLEERAEELLSRFEKRVENLCVRIGRQLGPDRVGENPRVFHTRAGQIRKYGLVLCDTKDLITPGITNQELAERYRSWLEDALGAFFRAQPDQPLALLLAEAVAPELGAVSG